MKDHVSISFLAAVYKCFQRKLLFMDSYIYKTLLLVFQAGLSVFALGKAIFQQNCITVLLTLAHFKGESKPCYACFICFCSFIINVK